MKLKDINKNINQKLINKAIEYQKKAAKYHKLAMETMDKIMSKELK